MTSSEDTTVHIVAERLVVTMFFGILDPHATYMHRGIAAILQEVDIPHSAIRPTSYFDARLDTKETRLEALGSKA
jgi:hypothetical protein